jgi:hypothetical protein
MEGSGSSKYRLSHLGYERDMHLVETVLQFLNFKLFPG